MEKRKILIVEDEPNNREVLQLHLAALGYTVLEAADGEMAIKVLHSGDNMDQIGLIFCDIRMPKLNGVDSIDYFIKKAPKIPIVVITGYPDDELTDFLINKGVRELILKPVEKARLLKTVQSIFCE
ncbi:MAG: response regulator [Nitrospinaceae bacterium]